MLNENLLETTTTQKCRLKEQNISTDGSTVEIINKHEDDSTPMLTHNDKDASIATNYKSTHK